MRMFSLSVQKAYLMVGVVPMEVPLHMDLKDKLTALCNLEDPFIGKTPVRTCSQVHLKYE